MDPTEYKSLHESMMLNNNGTSPGHVFMTILPSFFTTFITVLFTTYGITSRTIPIRFITEFTIIIVPLTLCCTVINDYVFQLNGAILLALLPFLYQTLWGKLHIEPFVQIPTKPAGYLTVCRSVTNIITATCILAVDFKCFPRDLAKTETYGFGLMDTGVGLYVLINGIVSSEARREVNEKMTINKFKKLLLSASPLIALGLIRFFVTNEIDYQQHISEYGVHWNFFMTLAAVRIFGSLFLELLPSPKFAHYASITILCAHEAALQLGLSQYVMSDIKRDSFLSANREGIVSIPGYVALYLISIWVGSQLNIKEPVIRPKQLLQLALRIGAVAMFSWKMIGICDKMFGTSRRLANMGYCFWITSLGATMCILFMMLEIAIQFIMFEHPVDDTTDAEKTKQAKGGNGSVDQKIVRNYYVPLIFEAINYNALIFFLAANLMTGAVNLLFQTMLLDTVASLVILLYYLFTLCVLMIFLYENKLRLKFW